MEVSPYHIHPSEGRETIITTVQLKGDDNYEDWSEHVLNAIRAKRKLCFLDGTLKKPESETELKQWEHVNSMIVSWIMNTIDPTLRKSMSLVENASVLWENLKVRFSVKKKYGLQIRSSRGRSLRNVSDIFGEDDDEEEEDVEKEISRQASKTKSLKKVEEKHKEDLKENPSAFAYDEVYDDMKQKTILPEKKDRENRKPKYIEGLMKQAERRQKEQEIVYERKLAKEMEKEEHLFTDKEKFVTGPYKQKLEEDKKWLAEERLRELREEKDDFTKKKDLSDFYFNITKNIALGAPDIEQRKEDTLKEPMEANKRESSEKEASPSTSKTTRPSRRKRVGPQEVEQTTPKKKTSSNATKDQNVVEAPSKAAIKRMKPEDAITAAKERFLARKKAKIDEH